MPMPVVHVTKIRGLETKPTCAVCRKPVESILEEDDPHGERVTWTVRCHGENERVVLSYSELANVPTSAIRFELAFTTSVRRLPP